MRRLLLITAIVVAAAAVVLVPRAGEPLKRFPAFRAEHVRVEGTRYLDAEEVVALSGITPAAGLFDDRRPWRTSLLAHPLVDDVVIRRRFPGTIIIRITEVEPVALARTPELRPIDARGRVLPIDPAGQPLDLPVLAVPLTDDDADDEPASSLGSRVAALVNTYERVRRLDPELAAQVSEIHPAPEGALRLLLALRCMGSHGAWPSAGEGGEALPSRSRAPTAQSATLCSETGAPAGIVAVVPGDADALDLARLRQALLDLSERGELQAVRSVDVRFRDQAVVSMTPTPTS